MAKRGSTEEMLAALKRVRGLPANERRVEMIGDLLRGAAVHGIVVKGVAVLALEMGWRELAEKMVEAARGLMGSDAVKRDPGCEAKEAVARALVEWESDETEWFVKLSRYRQMEPTFGGSVDRAGECRGLAAIAIARSRPPGAMSLLVDLLADPEKAARAHTAMALGMWRGGEAGPLLRFKLRLGDAEPEVMGEVFASLLRDESTETFELVCEQLGKEELAEAAALALGQSRRAEALAPLTEAWERLRRTVIGSSVLMAIGLLRSDASLEWLLGMIEKTREREAAAMIDALTIHRGDEHVRKRVAKAVKGRDELERAFAEVFGEDKDE